MNYYEAIFLITFYVISITLVGFVVMKDRKEYKKFYKIKN